MSRPYTIAAYLSYVRKAHHARHLCSSRSLPKCPSALGPLSILALVAILGTLLSLLWGALYTLAEAPNRLAREGARSLRTPPAT